MSRAEIEQKVWDSVMELNRLWTEQGRPEGLADYFAPEMIAVTPTDSFRREGRAACVEGWTSARLHNDCELSCW